jgi:hypothetical protein
VPPGKADTLISVFALHFLAGSVTGSLFAVRTLLILVALVLAECVGAAIAWGVSVGFWSLGSLVAVQVGYLGGIYCRSVLEHMGIAEPDARPGRRPGI